MSGNVEEQIDKDPGTKEKSQERKKKRKSGSKDVLTFPPCKVCSGKATGLHYGVYTCEPCKAFFRRAITDKNKYACPKDNNCEITAEKRGNCSACRLQKCFNLGMSKSAVRQGRYTIELRTNTILEVKRLANKTAVEVSVDNQKDTSDGQTSTDPAGDCGSSSLCDSETNQTKSSEVQSDSVDAESDNMESSVDLSLLPCQSGCGQDSSDSNLPPKKKVRLRDTVNVLESCDCVVTHGSQSLAQVGCDTTIGADTVTLSERQIQCLIQTLVKAHDTIYPNFKNYFEKEHQQLLEDKFIADQKIQEDVFGIKSLLDKDEFEKVYRATGIDVDGRLELLKKMYSHRERSLMKYFTFAKCIEGFTDLSMNDKISLVKYGEHEYWILGHFTHYHPDLKATIGNEIQMTFENHSKLFGQSHSEEMLKMFNTLREMNFMYQEVILMRGIVLFSRDRSALDDADLVESVQWRLIQCLKYLLELFHPDEPRKFSQCLQILVDLRDLSEVRQKSQKKQYDDYTLDIMKEYPLIYEALGESMSKLKTQ
ncbi:retinoic acid receptor alpha-like [Saccostrea echinata]|uniref:retinoic acid receptor alpha-like n=1 Tax=Saccostrea echinata TaxID=191078 RepID=UPI002A82363A|nr:retinoic acid receptor alpha-like [Saccostrea echinata]XP_061167034.1 retinoic acid receptor alpha-like [Saccostrea echinata]